MASEPNPRRFALRAALLVLPLVVGAAVLPRLLRGGVPAAAGEPGTGGEATLRQDGPTTEEIEASRAAEEALARARRGWRKVELMAPRGGQPAANGERVVPFQGFGLSVDTTPPGATVKVGDQVLGVTPLLTSLPCRPGDPLTIEVSLRAHRAQTRRIRCRADELVSLTIPLGR